MKTITRWSERDIDTLREMTAEGHHASLIAQRLGRTVGSVRMKRREIGLESTDYRREDFHLPSPALQYACPQFYYDILKSRWLAGRR